MIRAFIELASLAVFLATVALWAAIIGGGI